MAPLEHTDGLFTYAMALTRNCFEAEDLVQETYVRAIEAIGRLHEHSNVKAWLYTILRNIRLNQVRQQRARPKLVELDAHENAADLVIDSARDPHALYVNELEKQQVRVALRLLSEEYREIIVLREYADLSYQEIATLLNCPLGTVMSRLARARSKLGTLLCRTDGRRALRRITRRDCRQRWEEQASPQAIRLRKNRFAGSTAKSEIGMRATTPLNP